MMRNAELDFSNRSIYYQIMVCPINRPKTFYWHTTQRSDFMILVFENLFMVLWFLWLLSKLWFVNNKTPSIRPHPLDPDSRSIDLLTQDDKYPTDIFLTFGLN